MSLHIHNSLTRATEEFHPQEPPKVTMYTCGVTVYDDCHIGHARSLYIFEVMRRYLRYRGFDVSFVRNITDIDDKIINRANELKVPWDELVEKYIGRYYQDLEALGLSRADAEPRATGNIPEMIAYIQGLVDKGFAYATASGVYFNVRKFKGYGKLSGQSVDQMLVGVRKTSDEAKEDPLDFALWKASKPGEPSWPSPWGDGRPGWHIECSVMSQKYLKTQTLDIHAGGRDLIFPHHENEVCQAEALTGKPFARYWIHHGLLTINGQKMSKSLGNFVTIKDFLARHHAADILKLLFLTAHYSSPVDYTEQKVEESKQALERLTQLVRKGAPESKGNPALEPGVAVFREEFIKAMDDDFNTPRALAAVFDLVNFANKHVAEPQVLAGAMAMLNELKAVLGLSLEASSSHAGGVPGGEVEAMLLARKQAKANKDFKEADRIRNELSAAGIIIEDAKDGTTTWRRKL